MVTEPPEPPYYAVILSSLRTPGNDEEYFDAGRRMLALAGEQPGCLGIDTTRGPEGLGITVSYWRDEEAIKAWREHAAHALVQDAGRDHLFSRYAVHVARVERSYSFRRPDSA